MTYEYRLALLLQALTERVEKLEKDVEKLKSDKTKRTY